MGQALNSGKFQAVINSLTVGQQQTSLFMVGGKLASKDLAPSAEIYYHAFVIREVHLAVATLTSLPDLRVHRAFKIKTITLNSAEKQIGIQCSIGVKCSWQLNSVTNLVAKFSTNVFMASPIYSALERSGQEVTSACIQWKEVVSRDKGGGPHIFSHAPTLFCKAEHTQ